MTEEAAPTEPLRTAFRCETNGKKSKPSSGCVHVAHSRDRPSKAENSSPFRVASTILLAGFLVLLAALGLLRLESISTTEEQKQREAHVSVARVLEATEVSVQALKSSSTVEGEEHAVVASDHPVCSQVGKRTMQDSGGNVMDAAVATALCLGVANPSSSGIGGGAFILVHMEEEYAKEARAADLPPFLEGRVNTEDKRSVVIDCRETAPFQSYAEMFTGLPDEASTVGGLAVAVPGELRGLELAHSMYGQLDWSTVLQPAIELAENGVPVSKYLATAITDHRAGPRWNFESLRKILTKGDGTTPLVAGDLLKNPALAATLRVVASEGSTALYKGALTKALVDDIQAAGGIITEDDFNQYLPVLRTPLIARDVGDYTLMGVPPPSSGGATMIGAARFLAGYKDQESPAANHRLIEAMRHTFALRMSLSDPAYNTKVVEDAVNDLVNTDFMEKMRQRTSDNTTQRVSHYGGIKWSQLEDTAGVDDVSDAKEGDRRNLGEYRKLSRFGYLEDHGTTHMSVMDARGNAVAITSTVNTYFGSGVFSESTGIVLNSQMDDFSTPGRPNFFGLQPSEANYIQPGKKPLSSMSPTMVFKNEPDGTIGDIVMTLGGSGGPKIITATLQVFVNHLVHKMPLFKAMSSPRLHDQLLYHRSATTLFEQAQLGHVLVEVPTTTRKDLESRGHRLTAVGYTGCIQAVSLERSGGKASLVGVSDIRKQGTPAGY